MPKHHISIFCWSFCWVRKSNLGPFLEQCAEVIYGWCITATAVLAIQIDKLLQEHVRPDAQEDAEHDEERRPRGGGGGSISFQRGE